MFKRALHNIWILRDFVYRVLDGSILTKQFTLHLFPFIFYLTFLAVIYIANTYYAEKTVMEIGALKNELKELRYEQITTKSDLMNKCKQSEIAEKLNPYGIKESVVPPNKIFVKQNQEK